MFFFYSGPIYVCDYNDHDNSAFTSSGFCVVSKAHPDFEWTGEQLFVQQLCSGLRVLRTEPRSRSLHPAAQLLQVTFTVLERKLQPTLPQTAHYRRAGLEQALHFSRFLNLMLKYILSDVWNLLHS